MDERLLRFQAKVSHLSQQGLGVVKAPDGRTYLVRGVWRGDEVELQSTPETAGNYHFAELVQVIQASVERRSAACPHLGTGPTQCFGCPWMMVSYPAQLDEKQHRVQHALERVGLKNIQLPNIWAAPAEYHYRRRAQFKTDGQHIGYAGRQGLAIAPIEHCLVLSKRLTEILQSLQAQLPQPDWQPDAAHRWTFLDVDEDSKPVAIEVNRRRPFQQANAQQNLRLRQWIAHELQNCDRKAPVLELFAGSGNFTEVLVDLGFEQILATEVGGLAMAELDSRHWPGVSTRRLNLYGPAAVKDLLQHAPETRILLANPPRAGMQHMSRVVRKLRDLQTILYISCDPSSFAGDARRIVDLGFELNSIQALDQMPHTPHVEVLARFERKR